MKIAFFGLRNSFDADHIGGMDSIVRRTALRLAEQGDEVALVLYGCAESTSRRLSEGIEIQKLQTLADALRVLEEQYDHVVTIYLKPRDRLAYARFRKSHEESVRFHHLYSGWNESRLKRELLFAEARLFPFNGCVFCVSPRIYLYVSKWARRAELLLPPVSNSYFCNSEDKPDDGILRITYAGRLDPEKGTSEAVEVFRRLAGRANIAARVCGFVWSHNPEAIGLHKSLLADPDIVYEPVMYQAWTPEVDENLIQLLRQTDILLLPYRKLSSTVDTPLLLLEGMANLCAVITPSLGDLHETYGHSDFNLRGAWNMGAALELIEHARPNLAAERERLVRRNASLGFDTISVTQRFRRLLLDDALPSLRNHDRNKRAISSPVV